jgi:hypothetical protein
MSTQDTLEDEIMASWRKVAGEALRGKGDEAAMDEIDRLAQIVRDMRKRRQQK